VAFHRRSLRGQPFGGSKTLYPEFEMSQFTASTVRFLLLWGLPVAIGTLALSLYLDNRISRGHRWGWPRLWPARVGKILLTLINVASVSWLVFVLFVSSGRNLANGAQRINGLIGQQTPDLAFHLVDSDKELRLHQFQGRVVLLNLWATWCAPCVQELPELAKLQQVYRERGLIVITLSQEERKDLLEFAAMQSSSVINGYAKDIGWLDVGDARPFTLVFDRTGALRGFTPSRQDFAGFERMVRAYL